jgi:hypothetical protein
MRILSPGLPKPVLNIAFRKELREESAALEKAKPCKKTNARRSRPRACDEPPRSWRVPYTVGDGGGFPWFVPPL